MIFSQLTLLGEHREAKRLATQLLLSPYVQHQQLWRLFDKPDGAIRPFLFRHQQDAARPTFFMLSQEAPTNVQSSWTIRSSTFAPQFANGDCLQFELRANPSVSKRIDGKRGERVDLVGALLKEVPAENRAEARQQIVGQQLPQWLADRGTRNGFELLSANDAGAADVASHYSRWKFNKSKGSQVTLGVVDLSGALRVTEPVAFGRCVQQGLGHGKSFGLGMWMLRRHRYAN